MSRMSRGITPQNLFFNQEFKEVLVYMKDISKSFYGNKALDNVSFNLRKGEIHVILGENGAGKTTLVKILAGLYSPDSGEIYLEGNKVNIESTRDAIKHGIAMVNQYPQLVEELTVADNISLSLGNVGLFNQTSKIREKIIEISGKYGFRIQPWKEIMDLSFSERQRVEIIKAIMLDAKVIIMDEPTTLLTTKERRLIYQFMKKAKADGRGIILITHKLSEALEIADRITVLRKGKVVDTIDASEATYEALMKMMFGRTVTIREKIIKGGLGDISSPKILEIKELSVKDNYGRLAVSNISFYIREGEIYGIAGIAGNGQIELVEALYGLRKPVKGNIKILGKNHDEYSKKDLKRIMGYIPDKIQDAIVLDMPIYENSILKLYDTDEYVKNVFIIDYDKAIKYSSQLIKNYYIAAEGPNVHAGYLSGGNLQKLVLAREISIDPPLIIAVNPTRALDHFSTEFVYETLYRFKEKGKAVLLISEDKDEVLRLSDRISVMYEGKLIEMGRKEEVDIDLMEDYMIRGRTTTKA